MGPHTDFSGFTRGAPSGGPTRFEFRSTNANIDPNEIFKMFFAQEGIPKMNR